tara:strand:- start:126 stop:446 length:321 start_codon:yes stop_codon:yes gene_type:complete
MWIYLNNSFLSTVTCKDDDTLLHVRARREGDIENVFPEAQTVRTDNRDYLYRTNLPREQVAQVLANIVNTIDYNNFKGSIDYVDIDRHDEYCKVWTLMRKSQQFRE